MPEIKATHRYLRTSAFKVREVLDLVRGLPVEEAREVLRFHTRGSARNVLKLLNSAVANAEHNNHIPRDELYVAKCFADEGITLRRWRPRARGRATRIRKRTSHVTVIVDRMSAEALADREIRAERQTRSRAARVAGSRRAEDRTAKKIEEEIAEVEEELAPAETPEAVEASGEDVASSEAEAEQPETPEDEETPENEETPKEEEGQ